MSIPRKKLMESIFLCYAVASLATLSHGLSTLPQCTEDSVYEIVIFAPERMR